MIKQRTVNIVILCVVLFCLGFFIGYQRGAKDELKLWHKDTNAQP